MENIKTETLVVNSDNNRTYRNIYFDIDEDCDRLEISYSVDNSSVIDLGVEREGISIGWSGSERHMVFIEKDMATPGYAPGIVSGIWAVVLGLHTCKGETIISVEIKQIKKQFRWYKGDLHNHSHHSDGRHCLENIFKFSENHGFDFIAVTDHNCYAQNLFNFENRNVLFIPGVELSTYWGHMNYLGVYRPVHNYKVLSKKDLEEITREARTNGATVSINHPFKGPSIWEYGYDVYFDTIEVWNGPWSDENARAVELWNSMLLEGKKVSAIGGSDSHGSKLAHSINYETSHQIPTTWINSDSHSVKGLLENAMAGHVFITYLPDCPRLSMTDLDDNNLIGESILSGSTVKVRIQDVRESDIIKVVTDKGIIKEITNVLSYSKKINIENYLYIRLEVYRKTKVILNEHRNLVIRGKQAVAGDPEKYLMASLSNPVYVEKSKC